MDPLKLKRVAGRLIDTRASILQESPFFGRLLMHLPLGFAPCGTAYTDMKRIVFDPDFAEEMGNEELKFVLLHETFHCVLKHCTRCGGKIPFLYNVACDVVVNSLLLKAFGRDEIEIGGSPAMHLAPDGKEGAEYTAEEVYKMLLSCDGEKLMKQYGAGLDDHGNWQDCASDRLLEEEWNRHLREASHLAGNESGIPNELQRLIDKVDTQPKINWRQVLSDFIRTCRSDYTFSPPDRRYGDEVILPSFQEDVEGSGVEGIWFVVDTSGSVSDKALGYVLEEVKASLSQLDRVRGYLSYFDAKVSPPAYFEEVEELEKMTPVGGGGTSFGEIFASIEVFFPEEKPTSILILTDGKASFPKEEAALGIPVIWILADSKIEPPWGAHIYVSSKEGV
ncbi:MAG: hypothetical protein IKJ74_06280 [Clostridia bacterium]|nr:hypothetical protein [Clostridia bacterium]